MILEMLSGQGFNSFGQPIVHQTCAGVPGLSSLGRKPWERPRACLVVRTGECVGANTALA